MTKVDPIAKAKSQMILSFPFWGRLAYQLQYVPHEETETFATNGVEVRYNPDYVATLSNAEIQGCIAHEIGHCAFGHIFRKGDRDHDDFNIAGDYALNGLLKAAGLTLPEGHLDDPQFHGQFVEQIYETVHGRNKDNPDGDGKHDFGKCGEFNNAGAEADGAMMSEAERGKLERQWRVATEQAAQIERACGGDGGEDLQRQLDRLRAPMMDWRAVLSDFIQSEIERRYSWTKPNRRFIGSGIYLPSLVADGVGEIAVCVDTSGSISKNQLTQFASEIFDIIESTKPEKVTVVYCHHNVTNVETFMYDDPPDTLTPVGSGGTRTRPAFDWVNANMDDPVCLIYLTDLETSDWPEEQDYPVLWVSTNRNPDKIAPTGDTVHMGGVN